MLTRLGTPHLLLATTFLAGTGLVTVYSASALHAEVVFGSPTVYLWRQLGGLLLGLAAAALLSRVPLVWLKRAAYPAWILALIAVAATLSPAGVEQNHARRWLSLGGVVFQPLEITHHSIKGIR